MFKNPSNTVYLAITSAVIATLGFMWYRRSDNVSTKKKKSNKKTNLSNLDKDTYRIITKSIQSILESRIEEGLELLEKAMDMNQKIFYSFKIYYLFQADTEKLTKRLEQGKKATRCQSDEIIIQIQQLLLEGGQSLLKGLKLLDESTSPSGPFPNEQSLIFFKLIIMLINENFEQVQILCDRVIKIIDKKIDKVKKSDTGKKHLLGILVLEKAHASYIKSKTYRSTNSKIEWLDAAIKLYPKYTQALADRAICYLNIQENAKALEDIKCAVSYNPKDTNNQLTYAQLLHSVKNDPEEAKIILQKILNEMEPKKINQVVLLSLKRLATVIDETDDDLDKVLNLFDENLKRRTSIPRLPTATNTTTNTTTTNTNTTNTTNTTGNEHNNEIIDTKNVSKIDTINDKSANNDAKKDDISLELANKSKFIVDMNVLKCNHALKYFELQRCIDMAKTIQNRFERYQKNSDHVDSATDLAKASEGSDPEDIATEQRILYQLHNDANIKIFQRIQDFANNVRSVFQKFPQLEDICKKRKNSLDDVKKFDVSDTLKKIQLERAYTFATDNQQKSSRDNNTTQSVRFEEVQTEETSETNASDLSSKELKSNVKLQEVEEEKKEMEWNEMIDAIIFLFSFGTTRMNFVIRDAFDLRNILNLPSNKKYKLLSHNAYLANLFFAILCTGKPLNVLEMHINPIFATEMSQSNTIEASTVCPKVVAALDAC